MGDAIDKGHHPVPYAAPPAAVSRQVRGAQPIGWATHLESGAKPPATK